MGESIRPIELRRAGAERDDRVGVWVRRAGLVVLVAVIAAALGNVFGQRAHSLVRHARAADLSIHAPSQTRPGLLFQLKVSIEAHQPIPAAELVLSSGWVDGLTLNTETPAPARESAGPDGSLVLHLGPLRAGQTVVEYLDYQVNPTSSGRRQQTVTLRSAGTALAAVEQTMTIIP